MGDKTSNTYNYYGLTKIINGNDLNLLVQTNITCSRGGDGTKSLFRHEHSNAAAGVRFLPGAMCRVYGFLTFYCFGLLLINTRWF